MRTFTGVLATAVTVVLAGSMLAPSAAAHIDHPDEQHGTDHGHLPASSANVELLGKVSLTAVPGGIADIAAFGGYAYLNAFRPECAGRAGAQGTGVHVVDISDPAAPTKVNFLPAEPGSYVGEGVHVIEFEDRHILLHNNETCASSSGVVSGFAVWDVTDPLAATKLGQFGDPSPAVATTYHTTHSVQGFVWQGRAYAVAQDNQDLKDVDIFDITPAVHGTGPAVLVWEGGFEDWPHAYAPLANGDSVFHHDMQQKVIDGHNYLLLSYWDAGQILLNIDDPANPVFVTDSDFPSPDTLTGFQIAEGNSHQSYWSADGRYVLSSDEDFSPTRTLCQIATGPHAGATACGEFTWPDLVELSEQFPNGMEGSTVFGGSGCTTDENGNGMSDYGEVPPASVTGATVVVFSRGACFFSTKVRAGEDAGYPVVAIGQSHGGTRNGLLPDSFTCGGQGDEIRGTASAICIGHRAMHLLFADTPAYSGPEGYTAGGDLPPIGAVGERLSARGGVFDGWGYLRLHRADTLQEIGAYAVPEALDPAYAEGFGNLTVHEVKTDPRVGKNLAYASYYDAGLRVLRFGDDGLTEIGHFIADGGNDFWGVYPLLPGNDMQQVADQGRGQDHARPVVLASDRDSGLWIFRYTGRE